jgi:hypothetical protein
MMVGQPRSLVMALARRLGEPQHRNRVTISSNISSNSQCPFFQATSLLRVVSHDAASKDLRWFVLMVSYYEAVSECRIPRHHDTEL